ncbi:MAG: ATP-binding cassette domain-containing protein, partial [Raoultibacter sp.]
MHINIQALTYTYPDSPLQALTQVTATFAEGWTGIVGANGAGKSTLLSLLCGFDRPSSGSITPSITGSYCAQSTRNAPENLYDFASDYSPYAVRLRSMLALDDDWIWRYETLSHGEKKRLQVACALAPEPSFIALDEPTNHLDTQTRIVLLEALQHYRGVGLIVSHDRAFLDALVYQCLFLEEGTATLVPGSYSEAKSQIDARRHSAHRERQHARADLVRVQTENNRRKA